MQVKLPACDLSSSTVCRNIVRVAVNTPSELLVRMPGWHGRKATHFWKKIKINLKNQKSKNQFNSLELCVTLANLIFSMKPIMMHIQMQQIKKFNSSLKYHLLGSNCQTEQCTECPFHLRLNSGLQNAFISLLISYYLMYCIHRWRSCFK